MKRESHFDINGKEKNEKSQHIYIITKTKKWEDKLLERFSGFLPENLLLETFVYLDYSDLCQCKMVCGLWMKTLIKYQDLKVKNIFKE